MSGRFWLCGFWLATTLFLFLFGINVLRTEMNLSPDSMNYLDVASHIINGDGIVQSTLGFNQPHFLFDNEIPTHFVSQPPLYPLLIACISWFGVPLIQAGFLISIVSFILVIVVGYFVAKELFGNLVALLSTILLLGYFPLRHVSSYVWTEPLALMLMIVTLWLLIKASKSPSGLLYISLAGVFSGLAFATRYIFLVLTLVGFIFLVWELRNQKRAIQKILLYLLCSGVVIASVLYRNWLVTGSILPDTNPAIVPLITFFPRAVTYLLGSYVGFFDSKIIRFFLCAIPIGLAVYFIRKNGGMDYLKKIMIFQKGYLLLLLSVAYFALLIYLATQVFFDNIDERFIVPAGIPILLLLAACIGGSRNISVNQLAGIGFVLVIFLVFHEVSLLNKPKQTWNNIIAKSERLQWIKNNVSKEDLIIGDCSVDIPFLLGHPCAISFAAYPYTDYLNYDVITGYVNGRQKFKRVFFIISNQPNFNDKNMWTLKMGPFIADLIENEYEKYPRIAFITKLKDSYVFELTK